MCKRKRNDLLVYILKNDIKKEEDGNNNGDIWIREMLN